MKYLVKDGWQLNPNEKVVKGVTKAIERNEGLCPCVHEHEVEDLHCPCTDYLKENQCCCKLYLKL